jgi:hypothetical protein
MIDSIKIVIDDLDGGRVGLSEAADTLALANDACGAVGGDEDTLDLAAPTLRATMSALPDLAPLRGIAPGVIRRKVYGRQDLEALSAPCACACRRAGARSRARGDGLHSTEMGESDGQVVRL